MNIPLPPEILRYRMRKWGLQWLLDHDDECRRREQAAMKVMDFNMKTLMPDIIVCDSATKKLLEGCRRNGSMMLTEAETSTNHKILLTGVRFQIDEKKNGGEIVLKERGSSPGSPLKVIMSGYFRPKEEGI